MRARWKKAEGCMRLCETTDESRGQEGSLLRLLEEDVEEERLEGIHDQPGPDDSSLSRVMEMAP
jgi:hypothetical protein